MTYAPQWKYELLDEGDQAVGLLTTVSSMSFDVASTLRLRGKMLLTIDEGGPEVDWMNHRVRVSYAPRGDVFTPWGVWCFGSPKKSVSGGVTSREVTCYPKLVLVDEYAEGPAVSAPEGTNVARFVEAQLGKVRGCRVAVTDLGVTTSSVHTWNPGESLLTIVNKLLSDYGYWSLWVDREGVFQVQPWVAPKERPVAFEFHAGDASLALPDWSETQSFVGVPNRFIVATYGSDREPALVGVAENNDPASPFSIPNRGVVAAFDSVEASTQAAVEALAARRLEDAMHPVLKADVEHAVVPLWFDDLVSFRPSSGGEARLFTVQRMSVGSGFSAHVSAVWRGVSGFESGELDGDDTEL